MEFQDKNLNNIPFVFCFVLFFHLFIYLFIYLFILFLFLVCFVFSSTIFSPANEEVVLYCTIKVRLRLRRVEVLNHAGRFNVVFIHTNIHIGSY